MNYKGFFLENNKSGYKCGEKWLKTNHPFLYNNIINNSIDNNISFIEKIYLCINDLREPPECPECNGLVNFKGTLKKGYNKYCSIKCLNSSKEHKEKVKKTNIIKYGFESHNQSPIIKDKKKQTYLNNFDVDNPMKSNIVKKIHENNLLEKYDVNNPMKIPNVIKGIEHNILLGNEKNVKRVINKLEDKYIFIEHKNGLFHFKCLECNKVFEINANLINARYIHNKPICLHCNKLRSYNNLYNLIKPSFENENHIINNREQIGKEIDVYFPDKKLGVEINGLYWHCEIFKEKDYHLNKTKLCEEKGIQLLHFFEDEILYKTDIVKSIIRTRLGLYNQEFNSKDCEVKEINDVYLIKKFLETNHIQGFSKLSYNIGLFYNNELISFMGIDKKDNNKYEILRFCDKLNTQVMGGVDKLLKYFIENHTPQEIVMYSDRRFYNINSFNNLYFKLIGYTEPNYFHIKPGEIKRYFDFKERYYKIYDSGLLELKIII